MSQNEQAATAIGPLDIRRVMAALPHRYPMLLVDRVERIVPDVSITATKAVTINEGFFQGHFPDRPIMDQRRRSELRHYLYQCQRWRAAGSSCHCRWGR